MEVYINGRFLTQRTTGIGRYGIEICRALVALGISVHIVVPEYYNGDHGLEVIRYGKFKSHFWEQISLRNFLRKMGKPLLLNLSGLGPLFYNNQVVTIHDLAFIRHSEWFSKSYYFFYSKLTPLVAKQAKKIITVSAFSKQEIVALLNISPSKINVVPNAVTSLISEVNVVKSASKYMLAVSSLDPRKNYARLISAFLKADIKDYKLLLVGSKYKHFNTDFSEFEMNEKVDFLGYVSDTELAALYKNADVFIYPSLYEGFGIPPLEAMSSGCPVIVADIASLRETCGNAAIYVNPYNVSDMSEAIRKLAYNEVLRNELIQLGKQNCLRFSWQTSAKKVLDTLDEI